MTVSPSPPSGRSLRFCLSPRLRIQRRSADGAETQDEGGGGGRQIIGHAAVFNQWTDLYVGKYWTLREIIRPGAFKRAIAEGQDVRSLFNHDKNFVLGRTTAGTLALEEDAVGLLSTTDAPETQTIADLVIGPIDRKDVDQMSFSFVPRIAEKTTTVEDQDGTSVTDFGGLKITLRRDGDRMIEEWEILDANLFDISVVTFPAYAGTDVSMRSMPDLATLAAERDLPLPPLQKRSTTPHLDRVRQQLAARATSARASHRPRRSGQN